MKAIQCAAFLVSHACENNKLISNLQLQKMLFFAQVDYMQKHAWNKLFDDEIHAWQYGPVIPYVYNAYSRYGGSPILRPEFSLDETPFDIESFKHDHEQHSIDMRASLESVYAEWVDRPAWALVAESHEKGKAWDRVYNRDEKEASGYGDVITDEIIKETYGCRGSLRL